MTTPARIRLACLDMAGTTVSDDGAVIRAFAAAMGAMGVGAATERMATATRYIAETMGQSKIVVFTHLFDGDMVAAQAANRHFEAAYDRVVDSGVIAPITGAAEALAALRERGIKVCLTTGFSPGTRDRIIRKLGWGSLVDLALSPADVGRGRPWPDMVLTALMRSGIDAVIEIAVAGDTTSDLWAGTRSGASIVAGVLTGAHDRTTLAAAPHTHILSSITELPALCL